MFLRGAGWDRSVLSHSKEEVLVKSSVILSFGLLQSIQNVCGVGLVARLYLPLGM